MKYILIKKSEATDQLKAYADINEESLFLIIPDNNVGDAMDELALLDSESYIASNDYEDLEGDITTSDIRVPKKFITG